MISVAIFAPSRPSLRVRAFRTTCELFISTVAPHRTTKTSMNWSMSAINRTQRQSLVGQSVPLQKHPRLDGNVLSAPSDDETVTFTDGGQ